MPRREYNSSRTRVAPVFEQLRSADNWVARLLRLPRSGHPACTVPSIIDTSQIEWWWGKEEKGIPAPKSLLSYLASNADKLALASSSLEARRRLHSKDPATLENALQLIKEHASRRAWYAFEGPTYPDAVIETRDAIIVVEGKRTERKPTTHTTWMPARHQMWRHIDAAWETRGGRRVFGFFIVDKLEKHWKLAAATTLSDAAISGSFPHRSVEERAQLSACFLGITTWDDVCAEFNIDPTSLPRTTADLATGA